MENKMILSSVFEVLSEEIAETYEILEGSYEISKEEEMENLYDGVSLMLRELFPFAEVTMAEVAKNPDNEYFNVSINYLFDVFEGMVLNCIANIELFPHEFGKTIIEVGLALEFFVKPFLSSEIVDGPTAEDIIAAYWELMLALKKCLEQKYPEAAK